MLPTQFLDFGKPTAGKHQQPYRYACRTGLGAVLENFVEDRTQTLELLGAEEPLPLLFLEPLDVQAGVRAVGTQPHTSARLNIFESTPSVRLADRRYWRICQGNSGRAAAPGWEQYSRSGQARRACWWPSARRRLHGN